MKNHLISTIAILSVLLHPAVAKDEDTRAAKGAKASEQIEGVWELRGDDGSRRLKYIVGGMWTISYSDPNSGMVILHHGGSYTLDGDTYVETVEFASESTANLIGAKHTFKVSVTDGKLSQVGVGNPWTEEWSRVKPK